MRMSDKAARAADYLGHILRAIERIERIERYTADMSEPEFLASEVTQDAVIRNFEVIGEASRNIERNCPEFATAHPDLPLIDAYEMRNALAHGYFQVDLQILWKTMQNDLPALQRQVAAIIGDLNSSGEP
jgi:uncharacterized protein with HEPN domain